MTKDYDFNQNLSLYMQKKVVSKRAREFRNALQDIMLNVKELRKLLGIYSISSPMMGLHELREQIIETNRCAYRGTQIASAYKKARWELMRLKNGI